jgi:hypothetical protein
MAMRRRRGRSLPWLLAATTVGLEIAYPLVDGTTRDRVTIATVVAFAATCVVHAWVHRGFGWALGLLVLTAGGGFAAEAVGVRTGLPFGDYRYTGGLGPERYDVPLVVPLAWTMMAYPVLLAARRLGGRAVLAVVPIGAYGLAAWDVFLDPQMVADGHWRWADPTPALPGVPRIPLSNHAGWLISGAVLMLLLTAVLGRGEGRWRAIARGLGGSGWRSRTRGASEAVPAALLAWTWVGYIIGNLFWFGRDSVALTGGIALGLLVVPYLWSLWQSRP